jgi:alpha-glucosidase
MGGGEHIKFHNIYGVLMAKSSRAGILKANPTKRPFVLSRASFLGGQRYTAAWTGDNTSDWEHLKLSISMVINLGLSGQPFSGPDLGGFFGDADSELFSRWIGFGSFLPFVRGHSHHESIPHEPWEFGEKTEEISRISLNRRYKLMPYYYTQFYKASVHGSPVVCPTFFLDPKDQSLRKEENSFLVGKNLLVIVNTSPTEDMSINPSLQNNTLWHPLKLDNSHDPHLPLLKIREGSIIATQQGEQQFISEVQPHNVKLHLFICLDKDGSAKGKLYEDEGDGFEFQNGHYCLLDFEAQQHENKVTILVSHVGNYTIPLHWEKAMTVVNRENIPLCYELYYH